MRLSAIWYIGAFQRDLLHEQVVGDASAANDRSAPARGRTYGAMMAAAGAALRTFVRRAGRWAVRRSSSTISRGDARLSAEPQIRFTSARACPGIGTRGIAVR